MIHGNWPFEAQKPSRSDRRRYRINVESVNFEHEFSNERRTIASKHVKDS
jgi:hypothetical protein